jgi:hypothetical protein
MSVEDKASMFVRLWDVVDGATPDGTTFAVVVYKDGEFARIVSNIPGSEEVEKFLLIMSAAQAAEREGWLK